MREELVRAGIKETRTAEDVDATLAKPGTTLLVVNSICGCAAGKMRPGVRLALIQCCESAGSQDHGLRRPGSRSHGARPQLLRRQSPTSPAIAILRDGKLVYLMQRYVIEQATAQQIAGELVRAFDEFCAKTPA